MIRLNIVLVALLIGLSWHSPARAGTNEWTGYGYDALNCVPRASIAGLHQCFLDWHNANQVIAGCILDHGGL